MVSIGPKIQITGEDSYRLALRRIIQETKSLNSEMDLMVAKFDKNASALDKTTRMHEMYGKQIESSSKQLDKIREGLDKANQKFNEANTAYDKQQKTLSQLYSEQKRIVATMESLEKAGSKGSATWNGLNKELTENKQAIAEAETALAKADDEINRSGRVLADWQTSANNAETELEELKKGFSDTSLTKAWGQQFIDVGEQMSDFGDKLTKYVTLPLAGLGTAAVTAAAQFEDGMAKIYTIAVDSSEPMEKMRDDLVQLSNDTGFSLDDLSEATYQAVSASVDAGKAVEFMGDATKLARAGFTTTTKAVDLLTTVINAYGYEVEDATWISDMLLKTQNDGKTILDELASSMGIIIPMASNYGVGLDQISAAYATMTKQGVKTERATTFLRAVFTELEKESSGVAKILEEKTGKSFAQLMNDGNDLSDVLRILYDAVDGDTEAFQRLFGNVRATQAVASLVAEGTGEFAEAFGMLDYELERVQDSAGQTNKALEQMETPSLKAKRAVNQLKNAGTDLGESMIQMTLPTFEKMTDGVRKATDSFMGLSDETKEMLIKTGLLVAGIGPAIKVFGTLVGFIGKLMMGAVPLLNIIGALTGVYIGVAAAAQAMTEAHNNEIKAQFALSEETRNTITAQQELVQGRQDLIASVEAEKAATEEQITTAQGLIEQYNALIDENGKIKEGNEGLAETILNQLAAALGLEYDQVVGLIEENGKFGTSIDETIEKIRQRAEMAAYEELYTDAVKRKTEAEALLEKQEGYLVEAVDKSTQAHKDAQAAYDEMVKAQQNGSSELGYYEQKWRDAVQAESEAKASASELRASVDETRGLISDTSADVKTYGDKISQTASDTADKSEDAGEQIQKSAKETADAVEANAERAADAASDAADDTKSELDSASSSSYTSGEMVMRGFANGMDAFAYLAARAAARAGGAAARSLNNSLSVASPSKLTYETGEFFVKGFANAIKAGIPELQNMAENLGLSASHGLSLGSYLPETGNVYNTKTVSAPVSINLTVNGSVDDPQRFARDISDMLAKELQRETEVFA